MARSLASVLTEMKRIRKQMEMRRIDSDNRPFAIHYEPATKTPERQALDLAVARVNRSLNAPILCCHGKIPRLQCKRCG